MSIRICPERDAACPWGMGCPYPVDRYNCLAGYLNRPAENDVAIRPEGECSETSEARPRDASIHIRIPASLLEPGRQYTFTISAKPPEPLPANSPAPGPAPESDEASA